MNYLVHYSGRKEDWEEMAHAGVQGWSHTSVAHYMAKLKGKSYRYEEIKVSFHKLSIIRALESRV